jgi:ActR/RegA family two-component response regulator
MHVRQLKGRNIAMIGPVSVLLVDDEETFRESFRRLLERKGLDCQCACDGDEALQILQSRRFDVMITDLRMPNNPDLRLVRAAQETDPDMAVIVVTGYPSVDTAIGSVELSVSDYLTKPVAFDDLFRRIRAAAKRCRRRRELSAIRLRLQTCLVELDSLTSAPVPPTEGKGNLDLVGTIRTLAACLSGLLRLAGDMKPEWRLRSLCELLDCAQQPTHRRAIVEAVQVLKRTKETFKSKVLADLRTELEAILESRSG